MLSVMALVLTAMSHFEIGSDKRISQHLSLALATFPYLEKQHTYPGE